MNLDHLTYGSHVDLTRMFHKKKYVEVVQHSQYEKIYYIRWANSDMSADLYNLNRAKDHARSYAH
jgi:hypothetical protein